MALWAWSEAEGETSSTEGILVGPKLCARPGVFPLVMLQDKQTGLFLTGAVVYFCPSFVICPGIVGYQKLSLYLLQSQETHECRLFWPLTKQSRSVPWVRVRAQPLSRVCLFVTP